MYRFGRGGGSFFSLPKYVFQKCFWSPETQEKLLGGGVLGCLGRPTPPPGGRAGLENDKLLPLTMTRDRQKYWAVKSYRPKTLAAEE